MKFIIEKYKFIPFIIEETGEVIAYACNGVAMYDGFHAQQGGEYHAFEYCGDCPSGMDQNTGNGNNNRCLTP